MAKKERPATPTIDALEHKSSASSVAEQAMPGWTAVEPSGPIRPFGATDNVGSASSVVDAVMPSTEALHRKFYGTDGSDVAPLLPSAKMLGDNIKVVEMKSGDLQKSVGVNEATQKVEWTQG
jgi:hypothetical protein